MILSTVALAGWALVLLRIWLSGDPDHVGLLLVPASRMSDRHSTTATGYVFATVDIDDPSDGWLRCDGSTFSQEQYPELARMLAHLSDSAPEGRCRLPDYRGLFVSAKGFHYNANIGAPGPPGPIAFHRLGGISRIFGPADEVFEIRWFINAR